MNDLWGISARMAEQIEEFANAAREAGFPLTRVERLLVEFEDYALEHAPTDGCPMCFAEELLAPAPISPQQHGNTNIARGPKHWWQRRRRPAWHRPRR